MHCLSDFGGSARIDRLNGPAAGEALEIIVGQTVWAAHQMQKVRFTKGETIFSEGEPSVHCYKILSGKVEILLNNPAHPGLKHAEKVAVCGSGEIIGEMGVIEDSPRSASAVAIEATVCMRYTSDEIISLWEDEPREALAYVRSLIQRIRHTNNRVFFPSNRN